MNVRNLEQKHVKESAYEYVSLVRRYQPSMVLDTAHRGYQFGVRRYTPRTTPPDLRARLPFRRVDSWLHGNLGRSNVVFFPATLGHTPDLLRR